ncbi:hypothetical protein [Microvirga sesbaniae]|uniref:hypothetical protein n=1 Tax=Microvirga sesbaniae TaxID=681392 RepID=UPI0021C77B52|nr:hypothetical protein [Microvirga sp. HBU67692]
MSGYTLLDPGVNDIPSGQGIPAIAVGEPNPGAPIPVEPDGGPGGDMGPFHGGHPLPPWLDDLSSWFPSGNDHGDGVPPFCGTPPGSGEGPVIIPGYGEFPSGPTDPLDCW